MHVKTGGVFVGREKIDPVSDFPIIHNKTAVSMTGVPSMTIKGFKVVRLLTQPISMPSMLASGL